ncbi:RNA polymerase sigma-70 factor [Paracidobacterium acidisoli]|uniref:RNA polymerase sigma-70 factor n=1 Tax=Paracidobacterium acidisoli TaxID=2303751 RepID=A0A372IN15_9BACT|nr:RNA polymerase sigma-70 factor [Paracidobacterium acidisoli]MBT9331764.1 RNA polymerase sigma-70 factor [Paracidobacterium acidisoli]
MESSGAEIFAGERRYLLSLAYRMLGSMADAEDLVQEAWLRWRQADTEEIRSPRAYLTTVVTRLAINYLDSARVRREEYVGPWLPEPVVTVGAADPVELSESLAMAFLVLMESLTPVERAVFLLHDVFDYSHAETAQIVGSTEEACRQMLRRAKQAMEARRPRFHPEPGAVERLMQQFGAAVQGGDLEGLMSLLHEDITVYSDGGGRTRAALNPIHGQDRAARFLIGIARKGGEGLRRELTWINGQPGFIGFRDGAAQTVLVPDIEEDGVGEGRIRAIYIVVNPDKLQRLPKEGEA